MILKLLLAGDGGQGIQTIAKLLSQACFEAGFFVAEIPNFGLEQRGGVSLEYLIISNKEIIYPKFTKADIILIMSEQSKNRISLSLQNNVKKDEILDIRYYDNIFKENNISKQSYNIFFLGLIGKMLADKKLLDIKDLQKLLKNKLSQKSNWTENEQAFQMGVSFKITKLKI